MPPTANPIKVVVAAGVPLADAIKASLPGTLTAFADRHGFPLSHVSRCIYGHQRHERIRLALAEELSVDLAWLNERLDEPKEGAA